MQIFPGSKSLNRLKDGFLGLTSIDHVRLEVIGGRIGLVGDNYCWKPRKRIKMEAPY